MGRTPEPVTVSDALGRAERNLGKGQQDHAARVAAEIATLPEAQQRVIRAKQGLASYHHRPSYRVQDGEAHPERAAKAAEGVETVPLIEPVPGAPTPTRGRVRAPLTLRAETAEALARVLEEILVLGDKAKSSTEIAAQGNGTLDKALDDNERDALERFVRDAILIQRTEIRISSYGNRSEPPDRASVSRAYARMDYVQDAIPAAHWEAMVLFSKHMLCLHEDGQPTILDLGMQRAASKDHRVARGAYIGQMGAIAQGLHEAYLAFQIVQQRRKAGLLGRPVLEVRHHDR